MRIIITGGKGMLGRTLCRVLRANALSVADLPELDITRPSDCDSFIARAKPDVVIHAAAMTAVDACESQADKAFQVNALGSANVARACRRHGARLIALSTDYVFDGSLPRPYHEWNPTAPRTVYGASKKAGEDAIRTLCPDHLILRIAWLYGAGGPSFLHTMLKLGAQPGEPIKVVADQIGNPTSADAVADLIARFLEEPVSGTFHGSCEGEASWFDFARAIFQRRPGKREVAPCATAEYPRPAPRPANSRLEKRALRLLGMPGMPSWEAALDRFLTDHPSL